MAKCPVCGAPHRACGPTTTVIPVDQMISTTPSGGAMGLNEYEVMTEGRHPHKTTMLLSDADAKRLGVFDSETKAAKAPANKSRTPANKKAPAKSPAKPVREQAPPAPAGVEDASDPDASE